MVKIIYTNDESIAQNFKYEKYVKNIGEYPELYSQIIESIEQNRNLCIIILNSYIAKWLEVLAFRYGTKHVQFEKVSAKSIIEDNIHLAIPDDISDNEIIESELLDLKIPSEGNESFEDYILENFLGGFLNRPKFVLLASKIQQEYLKSQWGDALQRPLVRRIYNDRIQKVRDEFSKIKSNTKDCMLELLSWFKKSPDFYLEQVAYLRILQTYPEKIGERIFGDLFSEFFQIGVDAKAVKIPTLIRDDIARELNLFFGKQTQSADELSGMIEKCSGLLLLELENIIVQIRNAKFQISDPIINAVQRKFKNKIHDTNFSLKLEELSNYLFIPKPITPQLDWEESEMMEWAIKQFLPYRFQLEEQDSLNREVMDLASIYSDWLFENYPKLFYNSTFMAWKAFLNLQGEISEYQGITLVVMVDNLNFKFYPILQSILNKNQFHQQELHHCFSSLPSSTEVSKKAIITGSYKPFMGGNYRKTIEEIWSARYKKRVKYLANVEELRQIKNNNWDIYFLNYLPIDMTLHQSQKQTGISHKKLVSIYLHSLVDDIISFLNRFSIQHISKLIILSDHGSTKIPENSENVLQDDFLRKYALDEHHRFLSVSKEDFEKDTAEQEEFRYYGFNAEKYHLNEYYLVAKKYYRFKSGHDLSYIHGGLSPEETIVPIAVFEAKELIPKKLEIRILTPEAITIGTRQSLQLEITNHNNFSIQSVEITFPDENIEIEPLYLQDFSQLSRRKENVRYICPVNADVTKDKLNISSEYQVEEIPYQESIKIPVKYRALIETKFDFDNL